MKVEKPQAESIATNRLNPYWLAGLLEMKGSIMLAGGTIPTVAFKGTPAEITRLRTVLGVLPARTPRSDKKDPFEGSRLLRLHNAAAHALLGLVPSEYIPAKAALIKAVLAGDADGVESYRRGHETPTTSTLGTNPYDRLVRIPEFLAGILDGRDSFHLSHSAKESYAFPTIKIHSMNQALLNALQNAYGGGGGEKNGQLVFSHQKARKMYEMVKPYLLLKGDEANAVFAEQPNSISPEEERQREFAQQHAKYLAGFFEVGGGIFAKMMKNRGSDALFPQATIKVTGNASKVAAWGEFMHVFSPHALHPEVRNASHKNPAFGTVIRGERARTIIQAIDPYMHTRTAIRDFFVREWKILAPSTRHGRYKQLQEQPKETFGDAKAYEKMVQDPQFLAGVMDSRGTFSLRTNSRRDAPVRTRYPNASITTTNKPLLEAIQKYHGGRIDQVGQTDSFTWSAESDTLTAFYLKIKDHLVINRQRGAEILGWFDPQQLPNHILNALALTIPGQSENQLTAQLEKVVPTPDGISLNVRAKALRGHLELLVTSGRLEKIEEGGNMTYRLVISHPENLPFVEKSPLAMQRLLAHALQTEMVIAATGKLIATGDFRNRQVIWYEKGSHTSDIRAKINRRRENINFPFLQFSSEGRIINFVDIRHITDIKELEAARDSIRWTLQQSLDNYFDDAIALDGAIPQEILVFDPEKEARRLVYAARIS